MAYSKFIALMFGTQQIGDYLYGRKSRDGDFDGSGLGHTDPQPQCTCRTTVDPQFQVEEYGA